MLHYFILIFVSLLIPAIGLTDRCEEIDQAFFSVVESNDDKKPACRCYMEAEASSRKYRSFGEDGEDLWIGCTGYNMPAVFRALDVLNETFVSRLVIWNSLINLVPSDMFLKIRPKTLVIENCMVSLLRPNAFGNIGRRLKILSLRNNAFQRIESSIPKELPGLEKLDLSSNKISIIEESSLTGLTLLEELAIDNNQISEIQNNAFKGLNNLKTLNLANNKLSKISKNMFPDSLEVLILKGNNLVDVDWIGAFSGLKKLKILDLSQNQLTNIDLQRLQNLQRLYLNNNLIQNLKNVMLKDLSNLASLSLDRNSITRISDEDLSDLSQSRRLTSLSLVSNKISDIGSRAFEHVHELNFLSLQHNEIVHLTTPPKNGLVPFLRPLKKLKSLYLSNNRITKLDSEALQGLVRLKELALDHNNISTIDVGAFHKIQLNKLFLNGNQLYYLQKGLFENWKTDDIYAIDLSDNPWQCLCSTGKEWLGEWLYSLGEANTPQGDLKCLRKLCSKSEDTGHLLYTAVAIAFSTVSIICIVIICFLLLQEGKNPRLSFYMNNIQRVSSDREQLINTDQFAFPNPVNSVPDQTAMPMRTSIKLAGASGSGTRKKVHFNAEP